LVNIVDRELKFFFTSPLLIVLELASAVFLSVLINNSVIDLIVVLPAWVIIVLLSTFFELEIWRRGFLNKGVKLKLYVNASEYTPFLAHSLASLLLLELKTLIVILIPSIQVRLNLNDVGFFVLATHAFWLFALSVGYVISKDVLRKLSSSTAVFLCMLIFNTVAFSVVARALEYIQQSGQASWHAFFNVFSRLDTFALIVLLASSLLYVLALYACSLAVKNIRIDDI